MMESDITVCRECSEYYELFRIRLYFFRKTMIICFHKSVTKINK